MGQGAKRDGDVTTRRSRGGRNRNYKSKQETYNEGLKKRAKDRRGQIK